MDLKYLLYGLLLYLLYKFIVKFIIPIAKTFLVVRKQFKAIKTQFQTQSQAPPEPTPKAKDGHIKVQSEYIDFEEIN